MQRGVGQEYRYVRNIDGLPPLLTCLARHFLRLKSLHVQFSTDIQRYFVYVYVFFFALPVFFIYLLTSFSFFFFLFLQPRRVSETNSQHNFIYRDFAYYIHMILYVCQQQRQRKHFPRVDGGDEGGDSKIFANRPTRC